MAGADVEIDAIQHLPLNPVERRRVAPMQILTEAGIDARSAAFWQGGYDVVAKAVDDLEALPVNG